MATNPANPEHEFTGVFIPAELWLRKDISWLDKCLLGELEALKGATGKCTATNQYLADMMGMKRDSVCVALSRFKSLGLIENVGTPERRKIKTHLACPLKSGDDSDTNPLVNTKDGLMGTNPPLVNTKPHIEEYLGEVIKATAPAQKPESNHQRLLRLWAEEHLRVKGEPYVYAAGKNGNIYSGRDSAGASKLLGMGLTVEEIVKTGGLMWQNQRGWTCSRTVYLHELADKWMKVKEECKTMQSTENDERPF